MRLLLVAILLAVPAAAQYEIQKPKDKWQQPGEIQQPKGPWQVPKGIQAIRTQEDKCAKRFQVVADALFEFDKATLTPDAEETLNALLPLLEKAGRHPMTVEGHTDSKGGDDYNKKLSEERAKTVRDWLVAKSAVPPGTATVMGWGERRPIAPNAKPDGSDDPEGRQKNRRVEVVLDTCK